MSTLGYRLAVSPRVSPDLTRLAPQPSLVDLNRRRTIVNSITRWVAVVSMGSSRLDVSSMQLLSRVCRQIWKVVDTLREADITQPIGQQIVLARQASTARSMALVYGVRFPHAQGNLVLTITDGGNKALQLLENFDPALQGTAPFDLVATLGLVLVNTSITRGAARQK